MQKVAYLFPGQGSQTVGMGKVFQDTEHFHIAEDAGILLDLDVKELLCSDNEDILKTTHNAQLAILITSLMSYESIDKSRLTPLFYAGHSLGQVTALICSETISFEEGIEFASKRALETQKCADTKGGKMAALLGIDFDGVISLIREVDGIYLANDNAPGQIVIAGEENSINHAIEICKDFGAKKGVLLPVNGAFHTPLMSQATKILTSTLASMTFNDPIAPVVSNDDANPYKDGEVFRKKSDQHVSNPVRWRESMDTINNTVIDFAIEVGNGSTLAGLAKRCTPDLEVKHYSDLVREEKSI